MRLRHIAIVLVVHLFGGCLIPLSAAQSAGTSTSPVKLVVPEQPTESDLRNYAGLPHGLLPNGNAVSAQDERNAALFLNALAEIAPEQVLPHFANYLRQNEKSRWSSAIRVNLGYLAYSRGYFTQAMESWRQVWEELAKATEAEAKLLADSAAVEYALMLARVGRTEELAALVEVLQKREIGGTNRAKLESAREGLWAMQNRPEIAYRCGPYAIQNIVKKISQKKDAAWLKSVKSPREGFSIQQVAEMAEAQGLKWQVAYRSAGSEIVVPAVVHWKLDHFAAVLEKKDGKLLLKDPTFRVEKWIDADVLDVEGSGYYLVPQGKLPKGWQKVNGKTAATIFGKGHSGNSDEGETRDCSKKNGGKCGDKKGMAGYQFHTLLASLTISDTPIWLDSRWGPDIDFNVTYNQREANESGYTGGPGFGAQWESQWIAYMIEESIATQATVTIHYGGGGSRKITTVGQNSVDPVDETRYVRVASGHYERIYSDGSKEVYSQAIGAVAPRRVYLTQVVDSSGNAITVKYGNAQNPSNPTAIEDATWSSGDGAGGKLEIFYENATNPSLITRVVGSGNREARFEYSGTGVQARLAKITDPVGITSEFTYDAAGNIVALATPYGTTSFRFGTPNYVGGLIRWIEATDPQGDTERIEYNLSEGAGAGFAGMPVSLPSGQIPTAAGFSAYNYDLNDLNSFYWDKQAYHYHRGDYSKARLYHWLQVDEHDNASGVLESEKEPFESRVWYNYPGQRAPGNPPGDPLLDEQRHMLGTLASPSAVARQVENEDGVTVTEITRYEYNAAGKVTKIIDPKGRETTMEYETAGLGKDLDLRFVKQKDETGAYVITQEITYSAPHLPQYIYDAGRMQTQITYNARKQIETARNARNEITTYVYYNVPGTPQHGRLEKILGPNNEELASYTYDLLGRVETSKDASGFIQRFTYDALDRVLRVTFPDNTFEEHTYERLDPATKRDRQGRLTRFTYNPLRQLVGVTDPLGNLTQTEWCRCGDLRKIIDPNGNVTRWVRDAQGRPTEKVYADGKRKIYTYHPLSGRIASVTDARTQTKSYRYYVDGNLKDVRYTHGATAPDSKPFVTTPDVSFVYDNFFPRIKTMTDGTGTTSYDYHPVPAAGAEQVGALAVSYVNGPLNGDIDKVSYVYDRLGRVRTRIIGTGAGAFETTRNYDSLGRLDDLSIGSTVTLDYNWVGASGRLRELNFPGGMRREYGYHGANGDFRLQTLWQRFNSQNPATEIGRFEYSYLPDGEIESWARTQGSNASARTTYKLGYDGGGQLRWAKLFDSNLQNVIYGYSYAYDPAGNRISEQRENVPAGFGEPQGNVFTKWAVNSINQLTTQEGGGKLRIVGHVNKPAKITVTSSAAPQQIASLYTDSLNYYEAWVDVDSGNNDITVSAFDLHNAAHNRSKSWRVNATGGVALNFAQDHNGSMTSKGEISFTWDAEDRLAGIQNLTWDYDGRGRRVRERVNGVIQKYWIWCDTERCVELDANLQVKRRFFDEGEQRFYTGVSEPVTYYYFRDHLGSVWAMTGIGVVNARYEYDLWGNRGANQVPEFPAPSPRIDTEIGYTGHPLFSQGVNLWLAPYRAYDPQLGRWINRDPIAENGGLNLYSYVNSNPVNSIDPSGLLEVPKSMHKVYPKGAQRASTLGDRLTPEKIEAFKKATGASEEAIRKACTLGQGLPKVGGGMIGYGSYQGDERVQLSYMNTLDPYEKGDITGEFFDVVLEHEIAHYLYRQVTGKAEPKGVEAGNAYEKAAYGKVQLPCETK